MCLRRLEETTDSFISLNLWHYTFEYSLDLFESRATSHHPAKMRLRRPAFASLSSFWIPANLSRKISHFYIRMNNGNNKNWSHVSVTPLNGKLTSKSWAKWQCFDVGRCRRTEWVRVSVQYTVGKKWYIYGLISKADCKVPLAFKHL